MWAKDNDIKYMKMSSHPLFRTLSTKVNEKQRNKKVNMKMTQAIEKFSAVSFLEPIY